MKRPVCLLLIASLIVSCAKENSTTSGGSGSSSGDKPSPAAKPSTDLSCVYLSEINGAEDYVEIYNAGQETVSLEGAKIRRMRTLDGADDEQTLWEGTAGITLESGKYLCLKYEEGKENVSTNLKRNLSAKRNMYVWLQDSQKKKVSEFKRGTKGSGWNEVHMQPEEKEYSYTNPFSPADVEWHYAAPTPGTANGTKMGAIDQTMMYVVMNEIDLKNSKIELYNSSTEEIDLMGFQLRWSRINKEGVADNKTIWTSETSLKIPAKGFLVIDSETDLSPYVQKNLHIRLRDASHTDFTGEKLIWDDVKRGAKGSGWTMDDLSSPISGSMARVPDGSGDWFMVSQPTIGSTNGKATGETLPDWEGY